MPRLIPGGFTVDDFTVDHARPHRDLPQRADPPDQPQRICHFRRGLLRLPAAGPLHPQPHGKQTQGRPHDALVRAARQAARDPDWLAEYRQHRPMVERTIAWLTRGNRRLRYRGTTKNDHWLHHRAAALNLRRLINLGLAHTGTNWVIA